MNFDIISILSLIVGVIGILFGVFVALRTDVPFRSSGAEKRQPFEIF